jgi:hypothetical protein
LRDIDFSTDISIDQTIEIFLIKFPNMHSFNIDRHHHHTLGLFSFSITKSDVEHLSEFDSITIDKSNEIDSKLFKLNFRITARKINQIFPNSISDGYIYVMSLPELIICDI